MWAELVHLFAMICGWVFSRIERDWHTPETDDIPSPEPRDHQEITPAAPDSPASPFQRARTNPCTRIPGEGRGPVFWPEVQKATGAQSAPRDPISRQTQQTIPHAADARPPPLNQAAASPSIFVLPGDPPAEAAALCAVRPT